MKWLCAVLVALLSLTACADIIQVPIPQPYRAQIVALRTSNVELDKQRADLQKREAELCAQQAWNNQQMNIIAAQAADSAGLSLDDYVANVAKLVFEPRANRRQK